MDKPNHYKPILQKEDLLTNPKLQRKANKQRDKIDYSSLRRVDSLELDLESEKAENSSDQASGQVFHEVFRTETHANELLRKIWSSVVRNKVIRITRVDFLFKTSDFVNLHDFWGMWFDSPLKGIQVSSSSIVIAGWILGKRKKVSGVKALLSEALVGESCVNLSRPDVAEKYFFVSNACNSGFCMMLEMDNLPQQGHILIQAVFSDNSFLSIGAIQYCKY